MILALAVALSGCMSDCVDCDDFESRGEPADNGDVSASDHDSDLDGIPDAREADIASDCHIHGRTCASLGIQGPQVGVRDYVLVQYSRSGPDQDWRLSDWVWSEFDREMQERGIAYQVADLGLADDLDVVADWDDPANEGRFWVTYMGFDAAEEESAGWNEYNHIMIQKLTDVSGHELEREHRMTLLHEVYHSLLGDLDATWSTCNDEEAGGRGHSNDPRSILYVDADCESQLDLDKFDLGPAEDAELAARAFENIALMNHPSWWQ